MADIRALPASDDRLGVAADVVSFAVAVAGILAAATAIAIWPTFSLVVAVVLAVCVLAVFAPATGGVIAVLLVGFEGTTKLLLTLGGNPVGASAEAVGAAALDACLAAAVVGLVVSDRGRTLHSLWRRFDRLTRVSIALLAAWVVLSVIQVAQNSTLVSGLHGFRLTQAYVFTALAGALLIRSQREIPSLVFLLLAGFAVIALYAALRAAIGPSGLERSLALARNTTAVVPTTAGPVFRNVGSFSSAVGLTSFLVPAAAFASTIALFVPRARALGGVVLAAAVAGIIGAQVRAGLVALVAALLGGAAIMLTASAFSRRTKAMVAGAVIAALLVGAGATAVASGVSPQLRSRAKGIVHPLSDQSVKNRLKTWRSSIQYIAAHPLGSGVGTVGSASDATGGSTQTTDDTYLKIFREQGILGGLLFLVGVLLAVVATLRRIYRAPSACPIAVAGVTAFGSFLVLASAGEYIEQPGKVLAWTFLGVALTRAWAEPDTDEGSRP